MKMNMSKLTSLLIQQRRKRPFSTLSLITEKKPDDPSFTQILTTLEKSDPKELETNLEKIAHLVRPNLVSKIVNFPPSSHLGYRFLIWAMRRRRLRAWELFDDVAEKMRVEEDGFSAWWGVLEELKEKENINIPPDAFTVLITGFSKDGQAEKAVEVFEKMVRDFGVLPHVYAYNAILYVLVQKDFVSLALAVYSQMFKLGCDPNVATYSILIEGFFKSGKIQDALRLFDEMTDRGIRPNNVVYTVLLSGLCNAKRPYDAQMLLDKMSDSGCKPDMITFSAILAGFCSSGKVDEAFVLLKSFESRGYVLGINSYSCLIDGLFKAGRFEEANEWFRKFREENIAPDIVLYTIMIRGYCESGKIKDAMKFVEEMTEQGVHPDTPCYNTLIKGFCDLGLLDQAKSLKLEISRTDCFPDTTTYTILICGMCKNGLVGEAEQIFEEMEIVGCLPSVVTFNALIHGLCKAGKLEEARLFFHKMEVGRNQSLFLRILQDTEGLEKRVQRLCESGSYADAYRLLRRLADNCVLPDTVTYNTLINGMCKNKDINGALKLFRELQLQGHTPDSVTYGTLIDGLFRAQKEEDAIGVFEDMEKKGCTPSSSVYKSVMTWSCRKRKFSTSFSLWLKYLRSLKNRDDAAIKLVETHFQQGELKEAVRGLLQMDFLLKDFDLGPYTIWLIGLCHAKRAEEAMDVFYALQEFNVTVTPPSYALLVRVLCPQGKLNLAMDVFVDALKSGFMLNPRISNYLLVALLRSQAYTKLAFGLLDRMDSFGCDLDAHLSFKTKSLIRHHLDLHDSLTARQKTVHDQIASPG